MPNDTAPGLQATASEFSGPQALAVFVLGALGVVIGYFGLPWLAGNGFIRADPTVLRLIADSFAYGGFLVAAWFIVARPRAQGWRPLGFSACEVSLYGIAGFLAVLWVVISSLIYSMAGVWDTALAYGASEIAPYRKEPALLFGLFLLAGPIAALTEEILFRGLLYAWLRRRLNVPLAAILSAIFFTIAHPSVFAGGLPAIIDTALLAILLALLFEVSRSLWPCILGHALYNMLLLSLYLYQG